MAVCVFVGSRPEQAGGTHHWRGRGPPAQEPLRGVPAAERAAPQGVPLQAHPLP